MITFHREVRICYMKIYGFYKSQIPATSSSPVSHTVQAGLVQNDGAEVRSIYPLHRQGQVPEEQNKGTPFINIVPSINDTLLNLLNSF